LIQEAQLKFVDSVPPKGSFLFSERMG